MQKIICLSLCLLFVNLGVFAQKKQLLIGQSAYKNLKAKNKLDNNIEYKLLDETVKRKNVSVITPKLSPATIASTSNCQSCLLPIDATYSVVPFPDGSAPEYRDDDDYSPLINLPFTYCFYGVNYTSCYISINGCITFVNGTDSYSSGGFPAGNATNPDTIMIAPFWADVDTRNTGSGLIYYKVTPNALIVKWDNVGYYSTRADLKNNFQLIISDGLDPIISGGNNTAFCYGDMQWTTGDASGGVDGFPNPTSTTKIPATVGANKGDKINYFQIGRFGAPGANYDGPGGGMDGIDWLDNKSFYFNVCNVQNIPPTPTKHFGCDTLTICGLNDTLYIDELFLSPEVTQTTTVTVLAPSLGTAITVLSNTSGNNPQTIMRVIANSGLVGYHTITLTAIDNGTPAQTTSINITLHIINSTSPNPIISVAPTSSVCPGTNVTLTLSNAVSYPSYIWSNGAITATTTVAGGSNHYVTVKDNSGCYKSENVSIALLPVPSPTVIGSYVYCNDVSGTTLTVTPSSTPGQPNYQSYVWKNTLPSITTPTANLTAGTYTVEVTGDNGCIGTHTFTVASVGPSLIIPTPAINCENENTLIRAVVNPITGITYAWSNTSINNDSIYVNQPGTYTITVTDANSCSKTGTVNVSYHPIPIADFTTNHACPFEALELIQFTNTSSISSGSITGNNWNFGDNTTSTLTDPAYTYTVDAQYTISLIATSNFGCKDTMIVTCGIESPVGIPNVITPNGDNVNEFLAFKNLENHSDNNLIIYNRWGNKIFEKKGYKNDWSPKELSDGVYYFLLTIPTAKNKENKGFFYIIK